MRRASRLCSWIVKIADLYVVFIAAYSRGRYEREIQALPGTAASSRGLFFFFQKVAYTVSPFEPTSVFRSGGSREPRRHMARKRLRAGERLLPHGGAHVVVPRRCMRTSRPTEPDEARISDYVFPAQKGKCAVALMAEKRLGFLTRSSDYRRFRCIIFENDVYPIILKTLISRIADKIARMFIYIFIIYIIYTCVI